jgi:hypothetical protein
MPSITVNEDLTSHVVSDDGAQEFFLAPHNVLTLEPFTSAEQVEAFINANVNKYNWWQPFVDPAVREQEQLELTAKSVRMKRDDLLVKSDWTQVADAPVDATAWSTYRQALRDITDHVNFPHLQEADWPVKP